MGIQVKYIKDTNSVERTSKTESAFIHYIGVDDCGFKSSVTEYTDHPAKFVVDDLVRLVYFLLRYPLFTW